MKYLDPNDLGRINFKDFCRGVFAMKGEAFSDVSEAGGKGLVSNGRPVCQAPRSPKGSLKMGSNSSQGFRVMVLDSLYPI